MAHIPAQSRTADYARHLYFHERLTCHTGWRQQQSQNVLAIAPLTATAPAAKGVGRPPDAPVI